MTLCFIQTKTEGESGKFTCKLRGDPRPKVLWYLNGEQIINFDKYSVSMRGDQCVLSLWDCSPDMSGTYTVKATNDHGKDECSAQLEVKILGM